MGLVALGPSRELSSLDPDRLAAYDFALPPEAIAQEPAADRAQSRLMVLPRRVGAIEHSVFSRIGERLRPGDLLVLNDTRVIPARIDLRRATGGAVRGLLLGVPAGGAVAALLESRGRLSEGDVLATAGGDAIRLAAALGRGEWRLEAEPAALEGLLAAGRMPLPPYIERGRDRDDRDALDAERYQTVFARAAGAIAAPTAGLHFTPELLARLEAQGVARTFVTLHVGLGTFQPVRADDLAAHRMHSERYEVTDAAAAAIADARRRGGRIVAVGTTVARTLETAGRSGAVEAGSGATDLFIRPPFEFRILDALVTNFHLPKSTLLCLVAAFAGRERVLAAYEEAVAHRYRFFSYGDAMLID